MIRIIKEKIKEHISKSVFIKIFKWVSTSASFALLLSVGFFVYELNENAQESQKLVENLTKIEQSLSTRYLGIFPNYLEQIDEFFANAISEKPVIIFEDVLYYGVHSNPNAFKSVIHKMLAMADEGCKITIVHYDINGRIFRRMIQESRIKQQYLLKLNKERAKLFAELRTKRNTGNDNQNFYAEADSIISEKYFAHSRNDSELEKSIEKYLKPLYNNENDEDSLFYKIDEVKRKLFDKKPIQTIRFQDFIDMYKV